jgi:hypothetical protein
MHAEMAIAAAKNGKHILCEKPLAMNVKEAERCSPPHKGENRPHGLPQLPAHPGDCAGEKNDWRRCARKNFHFRARYAQDWLADPDFPLNWRLQKETGGSGVHSDINSHIIDLGRYLVGEFQEVCGLLNTFVPERPLADSLATRVQRKWARSPCRIRRCSSGGWKTACWRILKRRVTRSAAKTH